MFVICRARTLLSSEKNVVSGLVFVLDGIPLRPPMFYHEEMVHRRTLVCSQGKFRWYKHTTLDKKEDKLKKDFKNGFSINIDRVRPSVMMLAS
jgi:hypothetical protein